MYERTAINDPSLAYVTVLRVKRAGLGYDVTQNEIPGNREVYYNSATGSLNFVNPGVNFRDSFEDRVTVLIKY